MHKGYHIAIGFIIGYHLASSALGFFGFTQSSPHPIIQVCIVIGYTTAQLAALSPFEELPSVECFPYNRLGDPFGFIYRVCCLRHGHQLGTFITRAGLP